MKKRRYRVIVNGKPIWSVRPGRFAGWKPGKIFGRLTCQSGLRIKKENRVFFLTYEDAVTAGYRPCKNCCPEPHDRYTQHCGAWCLRA